MAESIILRMSPHRDPNATGQWIRTLDWARVFGMPLKEAARIAADGLQYLQFFHDIHVHKNAILPANMSSLAQTGLAMRIRIQASCSLGSGLPAPPLRHAPLASESSGVSTLSPQQAESFLDSFRCGLQECHLDQGISAHLCGAFRRGSMQLTHLDLICCVENRSLCPESLVSVRDLVRTLAIQAKMPFLLDSVCTFLCQERVTFLWQHLGRQIIVDLKFFESSVFPWALLYYSGSQPFVECLLDSASRQWTPVQDACWRKSSERAHPLESWAEVEDRLAQSLLGVPLSQGLPPALRWASSSLY